VRADGSKSFCRDIAAVSRTVAGVKAVSDKRNKTAAPEDAPRRNILADVLKTAKTETASAPVARKVSVAQIIAAADIAARAAMFTAHDRAAAAAPTTDDAIRTAQDNRQRSLIATVRGCCGIIMLREETAEAAYVRMLYGNARGHFSSFCKLPSRTVAELPRDAAIALCVNADGAAESYEDDAETVRVMFADK
jgi:hypothetical protein